MPQAKHQDSLAGNERRRYFRVNDRVGLKITILDQAEDPRLQDQERMHDRKRAILNEIVLDKPKKRAALHAIKLQNPNVAAYLEQLQQKITTLAELMAAEHSDMIDSPTHAVNISASGVKFLHQSEIPKGSRVQVKLRLFPSGLFLSINGHVIWSQEVDDPTNIARHAIAVDFDPMEEANREMLVRHIHSVQLEKYRGDKS